MQVLLFEVFMKDKQTNVIYTDGQKKIVINGNNLYISKRNPKIKTIISTIAIIIIVILLVLLGLKSCDRVKQYMVATPDQSAVEWQGEQTIKNPNPKTSAGSYIPGFAVLNLVSNTKNQKVNFYNPSENSCYFKMYLFIDNELVWKSDYIKPGTGFYDIQLSRTFVPCTTKGYLKIECYTMAETRLTKTVNVNFDVEIY